MSMARSGAQTQKPDSSRNPQTVAKFSTTSSNISGTTKNLEHSLKDLEADLKVDKEGLKEFTNYLGTLQKKKAELQKKIDGHKTWITNFESDDSSGNMEQQYKGLMEKVQHVYEGAKEFHAKGIDMLVKEFDYHPTFRRHSDKFTAVPFTPK